MQDVNWEPFIGFIATLIILILLLLLLLILLSMLNKHKQENSEAGGQGQGGSGTGEGDGQTSSPFDTPAELPSWIKQQIEHEKRQRDQRKVDKLTQILTSDPLLAEFVQQQAGQQHLPIKSLLRDKQQVLALSRRLPPHLLEILQVAATQSAVALNLGSEMQRVAVNYPTNDMEPVRMSGPEDLANILPEQYILEEDQFYSELATNNLRKLQGYESRELKKAAYLLIDASGSMAEDMSNGLMRHVWARGITISLLTQAVKGKAEYYLRTFDSTPHQLHMANTKEGAYELIQQITAEAFSGGGTSIQSALARAAQDLSSRTDDFDTTDVVLITDGMDGDLRPEFLQDLRNSGIQLHVILLGVDNELLKRFATSYKRFD